MLVRDRKEVKKGAWKRSKCVKLGVGNRLACEGSGRRGGRSVERSLFGDGRVGRSRVVTIGINSNL